MVFPRLVLSLSFIILFSCNPSDFPRDPEKTLEDVKGNILKVGFSKNPPYIPGLQTELVEKFADSLDAKVEWIEEPEQKIFEDLEADKIHMVIGGFSKESPWKDRVALTRPYLTKDGSELVFAVMNGENAFLVRLERFLEKEMNHD